MTATSTAVPAASAPKRPGSPAAISPSEAPTRREIAEVTEIAVWRELQNSQNTSPENRQAYKPAWGGRLASDASPQSGGEQIGGQGETGGREAHPGADLHAHVAMMQHRARARTRPLDGASTSARSSLASP